MSIQPWQAPAPMVGPGGKASPEWLRWLQQLIAVGGGADSNTADITQLKSLIASADAAIATLEATVAALQTAALTLETNSALNGSQKLLNLVAGRNMALSDNGAGDVTLSAADPVIDPDPGDVLTLDAPGPVRIYDDGDLAHALAGLDAPNLGWQQQLDELRALIATGDAPQLTNLGSAAYAAVSDFDAAGAAAAAQAASLQIANNLSDVANAATARANLGLSAAATAALPLAIANGGSGQATQQAAINALTGTQAAGKYLRSDGTNAALSAIAAADVPTLNQNTTGTAANVTGTVAIANGGTGQTTAAAALSALGGASLTAANTLSGVQTINNSLLGSLGGWQTWALAMSASGSMTVSSLVVTDAQYIRIGPFVVFKFQTQATLGGTASNEVVFSLPVSFIGNLSYLAGGTVYGGNSIPLFAYVNGNAVLRFNGNWPLGSVFFYGIGFYRCA